MTEALEQAEAILKAAEEATGWYCAGCHCGVDPVDVTFAEAHVACGRTITDDKPETDPAIPVATALIEKHRALEECRNELTTLADAAACIRHWHDAMKDGSGMVVSAEHVRLLWDATEHARAFLALKDTANG